MFVEDKFVEMQKQIEDMMIEMCCVQDDVQCEFQKQQGEVFVEIECQVLLIIDVVVKENGFVLMFNKFESGFVYVDEVVDVMDLVIQCFNEQFLVFVGN